MATTPHKQTPVSPETLITIKVALGDSGVRKLKLPLKDLGVGILPAKLRELLDIPAEHNVIFERFSDSAGGYITLDPDNAAVFKTLIRAAKAKLKLRLKATVTSSAQPQQEQADNEQMATLPIRESNIRESNVRESNVRESVAMDRRSIGSGIFDFKEAKKARDHASFAYLVNNMSQTGDAASSRSSQLSCFPPPSVASNLEMLLNPAEPVYGSQWSVYCNECDEPMDNVHFHCNICEGGDFDLCQSCVDSGKLCSGDGHWLIKRFIKDGKVTNSTTERIMPRKSESSATPPVQVAVDVVPPCIVSPKPFSIDSPTVQAALAAPKATAFSGFGSITGTSRTCNNCIYILDDREFVTCLDCEDFDLCIKCHEKNMHGHSPAHSFEPATKETTLSANAKALLAPGRNLRHQAICDACDQQIYGVRHKCQVCPDFDLCNACVKDVSTSHPRHRFAALYVPIAGDHSFSARHHGIFCDGPACNKKPNQSYITGNRYKCAVCHDTDFCASCEASPHNTHNRTHPLILFKTAVRDVKITTQNEDVRGNVRLIGDRQQPALPATTAVTPPPPARTTPSLKTKFQVMADITPTVPSLASIACANKAPKALVDDFSRADSSASLAPFNAHFVRDTIADGSKVAPSSSFTQVWTLRNPGPHEWPAGCSIHFVGGDNMLNVDNEHPASVTDIFAASESNICARPIMVNEEVAFKVTLKAPPRKGRAISYWRLKTPNGTPFGHRLWCDVEVVVPELITSLPIRSLITPVVQAPHPMDVPDPILFSAAMSATADIHEKARKDAAKARVEYIKAKLQKAREERTKAMQSVAYPPEATHSETVQAQLSASHSSDMVFPTLEKESPESSTYQSAPSSSGKAVPAYVENEAGEVEDSAVPSTPAPEVTPIDEADELTDVEVLSASEDHSDSDDDGFLTDEEYDILDASDRETVA